MRVPEGASILPASASYMPAISFSSVDLPAPFRPTSPTRALGGSDAEA